MRVHQKIACLLVLGLGATALPVVSSAAIYLCASATPDGVKEITGSVTVKGYEGCIAILSVSEGISRAVTAGGSQISAPVFTDITLTKAFDLSSIMLRRDAATGGIRSDWGIHFTTTCGGSGEQAEFLTIRVKNFLVAAFSSSAVDSELPIEVIGLSFSRIRYESRVVNESCEGVNEMVFEFDVAQGTPITD